MTTKHIKRREYYYWWANNGERGPVFMATYSNKRDAMNDRKHTLSEGRFAGPLRSQNLSYYKDTP